MSTATSTPDGLGSDGSDPAPQPQTLASNGATSTLPMRPGRYVDTPIIDAVRLRLRATVFTGGCTLIGGPVGLGKTTAIAQAARELKCEAVYVNMFGTSSTRDELNAVWTGITGVTGVGTAADLRDDIFDHLSRTRTVLIIDDAHHLRFKGLATLLAIWNRLHNARGKGTPIAFCGNDLQQHLTRVMPELLSRADTAYDVVPLAGKVLVNTVLAMEPLIAGTSPETVRNVNRRYFRGELRRWNQFFDLLRLFRPDDCTGPLSDDEVDKVLGVMPRTPQ